MKRSVSSTVIVVLGCLLLLCGCLAKTDPEVSFLLEQPYERMTDAELVAYEQELNDALIRSARHGNGDVRVGIGFGSWGGNVGYGVSADRRLGEIGTADTETELRSRRNMVREEMKRRGLLTKQ